MFDNQRYSIVKLVCIYFASENFGLKRGQTCYSNVKSSNKYKNYVDFRSY